MEDGNEKKGTRIIDEASIIKTIILGNDWQEVLTNLVVDEGMDPMNVDLLKLTDAFTAYLQRLRTFDFRIPARFILIAAVLLRMKCEILLEEEEKKIKEQKDGGALINVDAPMLSPPIDRKPTRKVTLDELIGALGKAMEFREKKEVKELRMKRAIENLLEPEEDIEIRIGYVLERITEKKEIMFSQLIPWKRKEIVNTFMPLLYLMQRDKIECHQEEFFKDIQIKIKVNENNEPG